METKRIEDMTKEELSQRMEAILPLCRWRWENPVQTDKDYYMQGLWAWFALTHISKELKV